MFVPLKPVAHRKEVQMSGLVATMLMANLQLAATAPAIHVGLKDDAAVPREWLRQAHPTPSR